MPHGAVSSPDGDAGPGAETRHHLGGQHLPEARVEDGVDREVDRRVGDDQHVADAAVVELEAAAVARRFVEHVPEDVVEERWSLADTEDDHDDDEDQRHVVVLGLAHALKRTRTRIMCI